MSLTSNISGRLKRVSASTTSFKDVENQHRTESEPSYTFWWSFERMYEYLQSLPDDGLWISLISTLVLTAIVWEATGTDDPIIGFLDIIYNILYAIHVLVSMHIILMQLEVSNIDLVTSFGFILDVLSYSRFVITLDDVNQQYLNLVCYYLRLHRPFRYFWTMNDYNLKCSVVGTTLMYCYIFLVLRITWALIWLNIDELEQEYAHDNDYRRALPEARHELRDRKLRISQDTDIDFLGALYIVNKMFIPIGPSIAPSNDLERIACLLVMMSGSLVVTGASVASLSLVISIYMRPEETFRARYRLIMREMKESNIPLSLREKVETFYKMYWRKQRAVSTTNLLPIFPPSLPITIFTDIYFKATQKGHRAADLRVDKVAFIIANAMNRRTSRFKVVSDVHPLQEPLEIMACKLSRILRDLSYQFLSEVVKSMHTIHYIPGDTIIKRSTKKCSIIYITYGDIEMLTAEDDSTAILRMTRGTILSPCGLCPVAGCARAHVEIRAATFCTAHVLTAIDLWKSVIKHGRDNHQGATILNSFNAHFEKVKKHYFFRVHEDVKFKSSILHFKRNLMHLQESKDEHGNPLLTQTDAMLEIAGCYVMRNRTDSSLTNEADAICLRPTFPCILQPNSSLQVVWHSFVVCLIIVVCITHPYYLVYKKEVSLEFRFYDYVVTAVFALDLMVHLSTGTIVEDGIPITLAHTSSQQACSRWFVLDVIGTLPVFEFIGEGHFAGINKLLRLPKVFRVLKAVEDECVYYSNVLRFLSFSLMILIACYLIAALQQGFMCFQFGHCIVSNFTHSPFWEHKPPDAETVRDRLLFSLYWAISMLTFTTHMDTWGTENWNNILYTMLVLEICIVLHIFIEAVYSATIMVTTALRENFDAGIETVKNFLARNEVDLQLRQRFLTYLQLCWYNDEAYSTSNKNKTIFHDLPPHVHQDIVTRQRSKFILCIPFMKLLHRDDLRNVSSKARMFYTSPNEILLNTGDITNEMYVIKQGICEVLSPETKHSVGELGERNHFGMLECLLRLPAFYTIRAVTHVQVFCIPRKHLTNAFKIPKINDAIEFAKAQPEYSELQLRRARFVSYQPENPTPNTERFRLPRKHEEDSAFMEPFVKLGFLSVLRYIFPRFTIRPDGRYLLYCEWLRATCALLSAMVFPSYTYLVLQWSWLYYVALLLDLSAHFDLCQRMLVGYFNDKGILVYHPSSTTDHYLRGAFMIDLFGCLPLEVLESPWLSFLNIYRLTLTKQILMLNRLLQLYRTPSALLGLAKYVRRDILLVINALPVFMALINVLTCFVVLYSAKIFYTLDYDFYEILPRDDKGGSWVHLFSNKFRYNITESPWNLHLTCFFWVIFETTTTGYNCISPSNLQLMQVLLVGMIIGALIITYFSVRIISIRANVNKLLATFQQDMKDMSAFMNRENLNPALKREVLEYYINDWEKMGGTDYRNVLKLCDQVTLRSDAILNIFGSTFVKCPILSECDESLLRAMGRAVRSYHFLKETVIIEVDDVISDIYIVDQGSVEVTRTDDNTEVTVLGKGSIFGNLDGPSTIRYPEFVKSTMKVHLLQISAQVFHNIIKDFPSVTSLMKKYRPNNESYIEGVMPTIASTLKDRSFISPLALRHRKLLKFFHFRSPLVQIYLIIISLSCIYVDVYNAGFLDNRFGLIITLYVHDLAFYWKFIIQYFLPYVSDDDEDITKELLKIRKTYFKTEFKVDILSCVPIELFCFIIEGDPWLLFAWLRLNRILRIVTVYKCLMRYHKHFFINLTVTTTLSVLIWFTFFIHILTCFWYFIDNNVNWCQNQYICSLYFILTTFTQNGVGDILPRKKTEVMFVSILQIVSTMAYMVYVGEFSNLIQYQSFRSFSYYYKYLELQEFLKNNRVSKNLMKIVNQYTLHLWRESRGVQVPYFLETAPSCLKLKVMSAAYLQHIQKHQVFECCEPAFLRQLVGYLRLYIYKQGMYVVKQNEITNAMYFIHTGRVTETCENESTTKIYHPGECFGVVQGLFYDYPHTYSYQSIRKSEILTLRLEDWEYLLNHFPKSKECIYKFLTYDDGSSDNYKDKPVKKERKVTIVQIDLDNLTYPKRSDQTTSSYYKSDTSLSRTAGLSSETRRSVKSTRSSSGVNFALQTDDLVSYSQKNMENDKNYTDKKLEKKGLDSLSESTVLSLSNKSDNNEELIVLREDTDENNEDLTSVAFGENIIRGNNVIDDKEDFTSVPLEENILRENNNTDENNKDITSTPLRENITRDNDYIDNNNESFTSIPYGENIIRDNDNTDDNIKNSTSAPLRERFKRDNKDTDDNNENITLAVLQENNKEITKQNEINIESYLDQKHSDEVSSPLILYDKNEQAQDKKPTTSNVVETQSVLHEKDEKHTFEEEDDDVDIIGQILAPTPSNQTLNMSVSNSRQADRDKRSK